MLFPDNIGVTSQGGSQAAGKADWTPLAGRDVLIWPDHDAPGAAYAEAVARLAQKAGAASVRVVDVPQDWPAGWDVADELPLGVNADRLRAMLEDAAAASVTLPPGLRMARAGLFFDPQPSEKSPDPAPIWVAAPFIIAGETRSDIGEAWGVLLRCGPDSRAHDLLKRFVGGVEAALLLRCVTRTGWQRENDNAVFVLPGGEAFGRGASNVILQAERASLDAALRASATCLGTRPARRAQVGAAAHLRASRGGCCS